MSGERPHGWEIVQVRDILKLDRTMIPIEPDTEYVTVGVRSFGKGLFHYPPRRGADLGALRYFRIRPNCLFISNIKAWEGAVAVASEADRGCLASNRFLPYFGDRRNVDPSYLQYYFAMGPGLELLQKASPGSADRNRTLGISQFEALALPLPPLPEQKKIAAILSSVDEAIQATQAVIDQTRRVKEGLLQDLLTRGIGHTRFKQTEIGEMPESWEACLLSSLTSQAIRNGYSPVCADRPSGRWILALGALNPDGLNINEVKPAPVDDPKVEEFMLRPGDFLVSRSNTPDRVGLSALFQGEIAQCAYPDLMMRFRVNEQKVHLPYMEVFLRSPLALGYLRGAAAGTSASMVKITKATLEKLPILLPPVPEQRYIAAAIQSVDAMCASSFQNRRSLLLLKSALLQDLLTGRVRVTP